MFGIAREIKLLIAFHFVFSLTFLRITYFDFSSSFVVQIERKHHFVAYANLLHIRNLFNEVLLELESQKLQF